MSVRERTTPKNWRGLTPDWVGKESGGQERGRNVEVLTTRTNTTRFPQARCQCDRDTPSLQILTIGVTPPSIWFLPPPVHDRVQCVSTSVCTSAYGPFRIVVRTERSPQVSWDATHLVARVFPTTHYELSPPRLPEKGRDREVVDWLRANTLRPLLLRPNVLWRLHPSRG